MHIIQRIFYLACLLLLCSSAFSQSDEENPKHLLYKSNKIKSVKVYEYRYRDGEVKGKGKLLFDYRYDTTGLMVVSDAYIPRKYHEEYVYNERGEISDEIADIVGPFHTYYYYEYDAKNRMTEKSKSHDGGRWIYTYDAAGNKVTEKWLYMGNLDSNSFFIDHYEYNDQKQITKMIRNRSGGDLYFYKTYEYDAAGNLIKETRYQNNEVTDVFLYHFDDAHHCIAQEVLGSTGKTTSWAKTTYDAHGLETDETGQLSFEEKPYYRKYVYEYY